MTLVWFAVGRLATKWIVAVRDAGSGADVSRSADRVQKSVKFIGVFEAIAVLAAGTLLLLA